MERVRAILPLSDLTEGQCELLGEMLAGRPGLRGRDLTVYALEEDAVTRMLVAPFAPDVHVGMSVAATEFGAVKQRSSLVDGKYEFVELHLAAELIPYPQGRHH